ncbi:MAG: methyltransferase domain-containing protein [Proteobacteria bacterium]|nr:methyltransferase domain-containing protein [Pseudomonadota bacterium]
MARNSPALLAWQSGALGRAVVAAETQLLAEVCDDVFGLELLQLGSWGAGRELMQSSRVRRQTLIAAAASEGSSPDILANPAGLPIQSGSIDAVLLPHCLEIEPDPGAILREADRVLLGEGQLIALGFRPWSLWGLRAAASRQGYPPGFSRLLSERRLRDWLTLLGYEVTAARHYLYGAPSEPSADPRHSALGMLRRGLFNPLPPGGYLLKARKRVYAPTPLRMRRRERTRLLHGLTHPST